MFPCQRELGGSPQPNCAVTAESILSAQHSAAGGPTMMNKGNEKHMELLTVQEIARLLKVPVSWVYGHTRKRSIDRLPGYRLGKYWRFRADEVMAWVQRQRRDREAA
jgi:excisionase family DNA binding protein